MNTQKFPDFVIVGPTSDELVEEGYFTDVTKYAQKYHDMDIKVRITPNINLMLAQLSRSENQNVEWYDELDSFLTEMRNEIINMDKKNLGKSMSFYRLVKRLHNITQKNKMEMHIVFQIGAF